MHQKAKVWIIRLAIIALVVGAFIGWEVREVAQVRGPWQVVSRRPVFPWQTTPDAMETPEARSYPMVRVRRWRFYGLGPNPSNSISHDKSDLEKIQGDWKLVLRAGDTKWGVAKLSEPFTINSFRGNERITDNLYHRDTSLRDTFVLHPDRRPKLIELRSKDARDWPTTYVGAYELEGDTLKLCFRFATTELPQDLTCTPGPGRMLWVFGRVKPGATPAPAPIVVVITDEHRAGGDPTEIKIALSNKTEEPVAVSFTRNFHGYYFKFYLFDERGRSITLTRMKKPEKSGGSMKLVRIKPGKTVTGYFSPKLDYEIPPGRYQVEVSFFYHVPGNGVEQECVSDRITKTFP